MKRMIRPLVALVLLIMLLTGIAALFVFMVNAYNDPTPWGVIGYFSVMAFIAVIGTMIGDGFMEWGFKNA